MLLIKNGTVHVGNGKVLENHDILIKNGKISRIGKGLDCQEAKIIDAQYKHVFPGFIDPVSSYGCTDITFSLKDHDEISNPVTPELKIKYAFNHGEILVEELYKVGITSIGAAPGNKNIIGGQMAAYRTWGLNSGKMLMKEPVGLKGSVIRNVKETYGKRNISPMTRMGIFNELEKFLSFNEKESQGEVDWKTAEIRGILTKLLEKEIPLFITANTSTEINALLDVTKEYDINLVIVGAYQAHRCLESIKERNISVVIGEQTDYTAKNYNDTDLYRIAQLQKEGNLVSFTLTSNYGPEGKIKYLWNAIEFYKVGVDSEEIVKMMTSNPAKMLGIDDILGTIEEGKLADLVIYSNNPIEYYKSKPLYTIVGGEIVYQEGSGENATNKEC
ncbi:MAG: amidohydrolase family protein [Tissierellia bacterium]|nr:amidohydrolase family protein [Tissierellia bacterium]